MRALPRTAAVAHFLSRPTQPAIIPIPRTQTGNNKPKSLHKTRRIWKANVTRVDWPVEVLVGSAEPSMSSAALNGSMKMLRGVRMQTRRIKDVEKAGGLEGLLLSRPSKHFTPFGRELRAAVFDKLHRLRMAGLPPVESAAVPAGGITSSPTA